MEPDRSSYLAVMQWAVVVSLFGLLWPVPVAAQNLLVPPQPIRPPHLELRWETQLPSDTTLLDGFTLDVRAENTLVVGYHPVQLTATANGVFPADRRLEILFEPVGQDANSWDYAGRVRSVISCPLQLTQGVSSTTTQVYLPHYSNHPSYRIRVLDNGRPLDGYETTVGGLWVDVPLSVVPHRIGVLLPDEVRTGKQTAEWHQTPQATNLVRATTQRSLVRNIMALNTVGGNLGLDPNLQALRNAWPMIGSFLHEDQLWDSWLGYESLDILLLPLPMLDRLRQTAPRQATAIRQFAAAGGTLWLYGASDPDAVAKVLGIDPPTPAEQQALRMQLQREISPQALAAVDDQVWVQDYVAGRLVCFRDAYPFPGNVPDWETILKFHPAGSSTTVRRGVDPTFGDSRFWNWVMPGVAKPPVYPFLTLLGLFAFCVGPVAYHISNRLGRVYLMLLAAPVLAMVTTLLMAGYGLISDGLGSKARVREVTWVDSASSRGLRWTRATYFTGIQPAGGIGFPEQTAVYPYPQDQIDRVRVTGQDSAAGKIVLNEDEQRLMYGFMPSRQQRQFVTFTPQDNLGGIEVSPVGGTPQAVSRSLRNKFAFPIRTLLLRDQQGKYWYGAQVAAGEQIDVVPYADEAASKILRRQYSDYLPSPPIGFQRRSLTAASRRQSVDLVRDAVQQLPQDFRTMTEGIVEHRLRTMMQLEADLPRGQFIALADVTPDAVALPEAKLSDSVHFCMGTWHE